MVTVRTITPARGLMIQVMKRIDAHGETHMSAFAQSMYRVSVGRRITLITGTRDLGFKEQRFCHPDHAGKPHALAHRKLFAKDPIDHVFGYGANRVRGRAG